MIACPRAKPPSVRLSTSVTRPSNRRIPLRSDASLSAGLRLAACSEPMIRPMLVIRDNEPRRIAFFACAPVIG